MKRKRLKHKDIQRRTRGLALVAFGMALVYLGMLSSSTITTTPAFVMIALLLTQFFILVGSLVSLRWLRAGAFITVFSALAVGYMFTTALGFYVPLTIALLGAGVYSLPHLTLGLAQWDLANRASTPPEPPTPPDVDRLMLHDESAARLTHEDRSAEARGQRWSLMGA